MPVIEKIFTDAINDIKKGDTCPECGEPCMVDGRCYKCETKVKFYHSERAYELQQQQNRIIYSYLRRRY
ncbi:MAG: hypothetical protein ABRQ39_04230 [Candidatus Eremiobacterota bacterium]